MSSLAEHPAAQSEGVELSVVSRIPVLGVVSSAALALAAAGVMSGYALGGLPALAALAAVVGAIVWWYLPRAGYWILLGDGAVTTVLSGIALSRGALPWHLVAFWGGSALLLAAILHLTTGAGRSSTITLVAVISLLALSALGLGQYVRSTWTPDEQAMLRQLPQMIVPATTAPVWTEAVEPAPDGAWACAWIMPAGRAEAIRMVRDGLLRNGWRIEESSANGLSAEKLRDHLDVTISYATAGSPTAPEAWRSGTQIIAVVQRVDSDGAP